MKAIVVIRSLVVLGTPLLAAGCVPGERDETPEAAVEQSEASPAPADGAAHTVTDLQALRYLEGDWRGSGYEGGAFYESYRFPNDSTIEMTAWTDSTMSTPRERSEYVLRGGMLRTSSGGVLVGVDENGHHFQSGSAAWTFRPLSPDRWTAQVSPTTIYTMDRIARR